MAKLRNKIFGGLLMVIGLGPLLWGLIKLLRWAIFDLLVGFLGISGLVNLIIWVIALVIGAVFIIAGLILFIRD